MTLQLVEIKALGDSRYDVEFDDGRHVVCSVFKHKGVFGVGMDPDFVMGREASPIDSRKVAATVIDYHRHHAGVE